VNPSKLWDLLHSASGVPVKNQNTLASRASLPRRSWNSYERVSWKETLYYLRLGCRLILVSNAREQFAVPPYRITRMSRI